MKVTILSKELIAPSSPTPCNLKTYKFSFIDQQIPPYYIPVILYYSHDESTTTTQCEITTKLKASLSKTLTHYYPLAGRLAKNKNTVDCTDQGVEFLIARVESSLFDVIKSPVIEDLNKLVKVDSSYVDDQLVIQVNLFECGGIAVGVSMSHRIGDACSISSFVSHWFALAKGSETQSQTPMPGPGLDSAVLFPPVESCAFNRNPKDLTVVRFKNLVTKRFVFSSLAINKLKHEMVKDYNMNPIRVEVLTAFIWKCGTAALGDCEISVAFNSINLRRKMEPMVQDHQLGNLFQMSSVEAERTASVATRVVKLRESFNKIDGAYVKRLMSEKGFEIGRGNFREIRKFMIQEGVGVFRFASWCRFAFNEGDFGWGKPVWVSCADFADENAVIFVDSLKDDGIEAWVVMNEDNMQKFENNAELQEFVTSS